LASSALLLASSALIAYLSTYLRTRARRWAICGGFCLAALALAAALALEAYAQWQSGVRPRDSAYGALVYAIAGLQAVFVGALVLMAIYTVARSMAGLIHGQRRATFDNTMVFWHYTVVQGLLGLVVVHAFPRLAG
jgi:cytochrome c oxidase subunit I+III